MNRMAEVDAGFRKKPTPLEEAAKSWAVAVGALRGMENMHPRPNEGVWEMNRRFLRRREEELRQIEQQGEDIERAKQNGQDLERQAMMQAMAHQHPNRPTKLQMCARCKVVSYCSRDSQKSHWKAHKKECIPVDKEPKSMALTWEQVEARQGGSVTGKTLEIRVILDESVTRQVVSCKDRLGVIRRVAAYTNSRRIQGLEVGSLLRWKNPRFHYFMDGSSGARIEEEDLNDIKVVGNDN